MFQGPGNKRHNRKDIRVRGAGQASSLSSNSDLVAVPGTLHFESGVNDYETKDNSLLSLGRLLWKCYSISLERIRDLMNTLVWIRTETRTSLHSYLKMNVNVTQLHVSYRR